MPEQPHRDVPVLLACDDEAVRVAADLAGFELHDPSAGFGRDIAVCFEVGKISGWKKTVAGSWDGEPHPRPLPMFFPVLCLWVLAASRMAPDDRHPTSEYHGRLSTLLGVGGDDSLPCFNFIGPRFRDFAEWLEDDCAGRYGRLLVPEAPHPEHVGYAVEQTVFRLRDRQVLSRFFAERIRGSGDGFDPARRLRRWSGRGALTRHAQKLVNGDEFAEQVGAAVRSALASWDGAELVETDRGVGRVWPATLRLLFDPYPALQFGRHTQDVRLAPLELTLDGQEATLHAGRELPLPWTLLERMRGQTVALGDPQALGGGLRLPRLGDTILFECGEDGILLVEQPATETVWLLTRDGQLQERLAHRRFNDNGRVPPYWELFYDVPVADLPGVERAAVSEPQLSPLRLEGGLPLQRPRFLSGHPPLLVAGDLETDERLPVIVNGNRLGTIGTGERLKLPADPGRYDLLVGDSDYRASYDIERLGEPTEIELCHRLENRNALRAGARLAIDGDDGEVAVCGAHVRPPYRAALPLLVRVGCDVETINAAGHLERHRRPPTPSWLHEVGLGQDRRWEIFCDRPVWLLLDGGRKRVRLATEDSVAQLSEEAAARVRAFGGDVDIVGGEIARSGWQKLREQADAAAGAVA